MTVVNGLVVGGAGKLTYGGTVSYNGGLGLANTSTLSITPGGSVSLTGTVGNQIVFGSAGTTLSVDGGSFSSTGNSGPSAGNFSNLAVNSGSFSASSAENNASRFYGIRLNGANSSLALNGGTTSVQGIATDGNTSTINFNGGTLQVLAQPAVAGSGTFLPATGNLTALVQAGGAVIDTNGNTATISQALIHDPALGATADGGLTKNGAGMLTLASQNTYTGGTVVNDGVLNLTYASSGNAAIRGTVTVNSEAELRLSGGDGSGFGYGNSAGGQKLSTINIVGGLVNSTVGSHLYYATVNMTGGEMRIVGGSYQFGNVAVNTLASSDTATISGGITIRGDSWNSLTPGLTFTVADGTAATDLLVSAVIGENFGSGIVTKAGAGTMTLSGSNSYSGGTTIDGGVIDVGNANAFGTGPLTLNASGTVINGSAFNLNAAANAHGAGTNLVVNGNASFANDMTMAGGTSNTRGLSVGGTGTLTYSGVVTPYNGAMGLKNTATLKLAPGSSISLTGTNGNQILFADAGTTLVLDGGSFSSTGNNGGQAAYLGNLIMNSGTASMGGANSNNVSLGANAAVSLNGGRLSVQSLNGGAGNTINFNGGTLRAIASHGAFINPAIVTKVQAGGAVLDTNGFDDTIGGILAHDAALGGTPDGGLTKLGAGSLTLTANNTYTGPTAVNQGRLVFSGNNVWSSSTVTVAGGATLELATPGTANNTSGNTTVNGAGTVLKTGAGYWRWGSGIATFSLGAGSLIDVQEGTFDAGSSANENWSSNLSSLNVAGGASIVELAYTPSQFDALTGGGTVSLNSTSGPGPHTFTIGANNTAAGAYNAAGTATFSGVISQGGSLIKTGTGTQILSGANTYSGGTTVNAGTLLVSNTSGSGTGSGPVNVNAGTLGGNGTIGGSVSVVDGMISAGNSPGMLTIGGAYSQTGGTLLAEIGGYDPGVGGYDQIAVGQTATLGGTVDVTLVSGFIPAVGSEFDILTAVGGITNDVGDVNFVYHGDMLPATFWIPSVADRFDLGTGAETLRLTVGVPEPSTFLLAALGLLGLGLYRWRRRER